MLKLVYEMIHLIVCDKWIFASYWSLVFKAEFVVSHKLEICILMGYYAAYSGNSLQMLEDNIRSHLQG
jgi:hypothetical protein